MDFRTWLRKQSYREDTAGTISRRALSDHRWDGKQSTLKHLMKGDSLLDDVICEYREYRRQLLESGASSRRNAKGPYTLTCGGFEKVFDTKRSIYSYYRQLKDRCTHKPIAHEDKEALCALFAGHGNVTMDDKIEVKMSLRDGVMCFHRNDRPISVKKAIECIGKDEQEQDRHLAITNFKNAARREIQEQVDAVERLSADHHIDHEGYFFCHILHDWIDSIGHKISDVETVGAGLDIRFRNPALAKNWREYHLARANLRSIPASLNSSIKPDHLDWSMY